MSGTVFVLYQSTPLQRARLRSLNARQPVHLVEVVRRSAHYDWGDGLADPGYPLETLFDDPPGNSAAEAAAVIRVLNRIRPDTVFVQGYARQFARAVTRYSLQKGTPSVLISVSTSREAQTHPITEAIKRWIINGHNAAFVGGVAQAREITRLGMPERRVFVGHNVVDNDWIAKRVDAARAVGPDAAPFLCVSRLVWQKNLHTLIDAFAAFARAVPDGRRPLHIAGYGPLQSELQARIDAAGLTDRVVLLGGVPYSDMPARYAQAAAFVLVSQSEPWGLVVNEAMAAGLPLAISAAAGCVEDLVHPGRNGFVFEHDDTAAITNALIALDRHPQARAAMAAESRAIISDWTLDTYASGAAAAVEAAHGASVPIGATLKARAAIAALARRPDRVRGFENKTG